MREREWAWAGGKWEGQADCMLNPEQDMGAWFYKPEMMTWAKIKSQTPNQLSRPGSPHCGFNIYILVANYVVYLLYAY